jgi:hypothetical protein
MRFPQPSRTILSGAILLILAGAAAFLTREEFAESAQGRDSGMQPNQRIERTGETPLHSRDSKRLRRVDRIEKLISEQFSKEREAEFYAYRDGMSLSYSERGLMDFYGQMRNALRGDEDSVTEIFTTYRVGEDEGYGGFINILIENLGDDFFFQQVQKQPESIQYEILGHIWQTISRFPLNYQSDGGIPLADGGLGGLYFPKTGELFLKLLEKELQSDYWQRQKKLRSEQAAPEQRLPAAQF